MQKPSSTRSAQLGIFAMPDSLDDGGDSDSSDLEAELAAISNDSYKPRPRRKQAPAPAPDLDSMIAASLRDIPSDEEVSDGEDDPDILSELKELGIEESVAPTPSSQVSRPAPPPPGAKNEGGLVGLLQERIKNYTLAEKNAKAKGESARERRFARGLKTLTDLLKQVRAGKTINEDDIPPIVSTGKQPLPLQPTALAADDSIPHVEAPTSHIDAPTPHIDASDVEESEETSSSPVALPGVGQVTGESTMSEERQKGLRAILQRREEFKEAALKAKTAGDKQVALEYLKMVKQFDLVVKAYRSGEVMDLSELPRVGDVTVHTGREENSLQQSSGDPEPGPEPEEAPAVGLITASTVQEALQQRLDVYKEQVEKAKEQGNSSKMRRMGRIVKQYEDALKLHAAGRPVPLDELPTPPGFAPIPSGGPQKHAVSPPAAGPSQPPPAPRPSASMRPAPAPGSALPTTRAGKQLAFLLQRQKEFKEAALQAKKEGEINLAKEYLRNAKGFDSVIEAARGGLVVDLNSLPLPPQTKKQLEDTFDVISAEDCAPGSGESEDVLTRLQEQLTSQLRLCLATRDHNKAMGNIPEANRFEQLASSVKQDRDVVVLAKRTGGDIPKFHYEMRTFAIVQCNTDLNDNDLELTIVQGITYNVPNPKEIDTYVKFEYPYPQDAPVYDKTSIVRNTNSPEYNSVFSLSIQRSSRACLRLFKRHAIKLEVYSRGGFFSRDSLIGTVQVKLQPLETHTTIHEAFPLMDGRRVAGGSLEVKIRVRNPLLGKQIDHSQHKWLVIDHNAQGASL